MATPKFLRPENLFSANNLRRFMSYWPPFLGAGVKIREFDDDGTRVLVTHKPNALTRNAKGTAFGGTIMAMTDPFFMLAAMHRLGPEYNVWDTQGTVKFVKPGKGLLTADMRISDELYDEIIAKTADGSKYLHWFDVDVTDEKGDVVAHVSREVYFRRKKKQVLNAR
ncbi:DUF4442 domain-containing protein [Corynebacterium aquatimens]|uniref:Acyl-coenzyme A thioesterase PaaI-like protein n=1 Tax=Corynebacterium aquatimens TaxID=1190508 RepID=A0A931GRZ2_9CORY|nr:DUF4442 domain-containing protein [Corynebacterium aquatimens]MBG6122503.1 acyl-coenzyme A thioesterase PaaI-like protein [Corynebacterium aquatimens]WJY64957.1 hypothetical protein CAQUA_01090 [Corynebacterium aquatimens]